jgi:hypothetical protein
MDPMEGDKTGKTKGYTALHSLCLFLYKILVTIINYKLRINH